ncbi:hypothetical protein VTN77DRAFT_2616 [Rasamsonia byssochlamydoides]|uniref:uncharacterized protein n=1 Tax=Rasamsonia byssochlamydoides TaxID=89139 RepID=UPI003742BCEB
MASAPSTFIQDEISAPKPIPAFYCCYLLRSTVRHASLYVGSTPNPARRLAQHNGVAKGGAHRTARNSLRPWEMVVLVEGFMSRIGALQFEWAWQNAGDSRHIESDEYSSVHSSNIRINPQTGTARRGGHRRKARSLTSHLADLHLLLRSPYFSRWPLTVRFLSQDVYRVWQVWSERVDGLLPDNIEVKLDTTPQDADMNRGNGVAHIDVSYNNMKEHLEKAMFLLDDSETILCGVCKEQLVLQDDLVVVCPQTNCRCAAHIVCLSRHFLNDAGSPNQLIPTSGSCPACKSTVTWSSLMKELSLRLRGEKETQKIFKTKRKRRLNPADGQKNRVDQKKLPDRSVSTADSPDDDGTGSEDGLYNEYDQDELLLDNWIEVVDLGSDSDDSPAEPKRAQSRVEIVIEDSDWDDAEIVD